ncbi:MAG: fimbrillin family protein [Bacteroidales bacterium]|nr:fimbrillin family protein [Bacteroidales bacterium]
MRSFRSILLLAALVMAGSCVMEDPVVPSVGDTPIEFSASKMRVITKAGDSAEPFDDGTKFKLFAVEDSGGAHNWSNTVLYDRSGVLASGLVSYGDKVSYGVDPFNVLDFYGVTNGTESEVPVSGPEGQTPKVAVVRGTDGRLPDLMYSDNLKSKTSASGRLEMEFRHTMAKLNIEILKQDESADSEKKLTDAVLKKIVLKGTGVSGTYNIETGLWENVSMKTDGIIVFDDTHRISEKADRVVSDHLVIPVKEGDVSLTVYLSGIDGGKESVTHTLKISEDQNLNLEQNHEYTLSIAVLKNDVRVVTVTPKVYEWIDVELDTGDAYFGQPVYFGGLMWMDRNLGAKSADCENDWYNTIGYYYQHGRNIPYILDVDVWKKKYNASDRTDFSGGVFKDDLIYTIDAAGDTICTYQPPGASSSVHLYDDVALKPGDKGIYEFICGFSGASAWARGADNSEDDRNHVYWNEIDNQPCPKGWRLPTQEDLYKYMPDAFKASAVWQHSYSNGNNLNNDYHSGSNNAIGEVYDWKYFTAKFKVDESSVGDWSYPVSDEFPRVYLIKYEGTASAYRVMIEQRKANTDDPAGSMQKMYVRISRFETTADDKFLMSSDRKQWNLHKFDWSTPAEYMDFPLCGYIDAGGTYPFVNDFGDGCILRAMETYLPNSAIGRNWTIYLRNEHQGVAVGGNSRRSLGDQVRCVRDVNAK